MLKIYNIDIILIQFLRHKFQGWQKIIYSKYDILIVDDSKFIIALLKDILKSKGFTCKAVENTSKAIEELNHHTPKLVLLDVNFPDSNGYEFCKMLKSKNEFGNVLIYYFTGISEAEIAVKTLETQADGYLKKPFDFYDFNDILDQLEQNNAI